MSHDRKTEEKERAILEARHVTKEYPAPGGRTLKACDDISLSVVRGKTLGIVGESGCGKSTFVKMLVRMEEPTAGEILYEGKDIAKLKGEALRQSRRHIQMVFQDPMAFFSPKMKTIDILTEPLLNCKKIKRSEKEEKAKELLRMVELPDELLCRYPHSMSGGQRQRVGIARALALDPEVLVCDEATSALDVSVQEKIVELLVKLQRERGISMVFICHDVALVQSLSHTVAVMYLGNVVEILPGSKLKSEALHPYTKALLGSVFSTHMDFSKKIESIDSEPPSPVDIPAGCPFQNRCGRCMEICQREKPLLRQIRPGHQTACHLYRP